MIAAQIDVDYLQRRWELLPGEDRAASFLLEDLIDSQDQSDDPRRRGSVGLSPMYLSLHFFGVPYLLGVLKAAETEADA